VVEDGDPVVVRLFGEFDLAGVREVGRRLGGVCGDVAVDCSGLTFIDCAGLGVLAAAASAFRRRGSRLVVIGRSPWLRRLLELTGLDEALGVCSGGIES
jgi:stage II sporulation protein AA (anti-sigma F factor antagonist)